MKTNIWKMKSGIYVDPTGNEKNPLIWNESRKQWERVNAPMKPIDFSEAHELTAEEVVRARLVKLTPFEDEAEPKGENK